jgi:hypothetical protein
LERFRRDGGQELLEFALILPLLLLILLGIMEFGLVILSYNTIANAAREGARYGIVNPSDTGGIQAAAMGMTSGLDQGAVTVLVNNPPPASDQIRVRVNYDHTLITGPIIAAAGGSPTLPLSTVATMWAEQPYEEPEP